MVTSNEDNRLLRPERHSTLGKAQRTAAWVLKFLFLCSRNISHVFVGFLVFFNIVPSLFTTRYFTYVALDLGDRFLVWDDQRCYPPSDAQIATHGLWKSAEGIWHCSDRLVNIEQGPKKPIFLSAKSPLTRLVMMECHLRVRHQKTIHLPNSSRLSSVPKRANALKACYAGVLNMASVALRRQYRSKSHRFHRYLGLGWYSIRHGKFRRLTWPGP